MKLFRRVLPETQRVQAAVDGVSPLARPAFRDISAICSFVRFFALCFPPLRPILAGVHVSLCSFVIRLFAFVFLESDIERNRIVNPKPSAISSMIGNPATIAFALGEWNAQVI
jgi:hypothetical protein